VSMTTLVGCDGGLTVDGVPEGIHDIQVEGTFPVSWVIDDRLAINPLWDSILIAGRVSCPRDAD
jgi:hypothetical protein